MRLQRRQRSRTALLIASILLALAACTAPASSGGGNEPPSDAQQQSSQPPKGFDLTFTDAPGVVTGFAADGSHISEARGNIRISADDRFTKRNGDKVISESQVLLITVNNQERISHIGTPLTIAHQDLKDLLPEIGRTATGNTARLNAAYAQHRDLWQGKTTAIVVNSPNGVPLAVYAGSKVDVIDTDVPNAAYIKIDGNYLLLYAATLSMYDVKLL